MLYVRVERNTEGRATVAYVVDAERRKMLANNYCENRNDWKTYEVAAALGGRLHRHRCRRACVAAL